MDDGNKSKTFSNFSKMLSSFHSTIGWHIRPVIGSIHLSFE